jgi:hypothetical protein
MKTFAEYLEDCRVTDTPRGKFIDDAKTLIHADAFPEVKCWPDLYRYVIGRPTYSNETMDIARKLWRAHLKSNQLEPVS